MAHELTEFDSAFFQKSVWHGLGTITDAPITEEQLAAVMHFDIVKRELWTIEVATDEKGKTLYGSDGKPLDKLDDNGNPIMLMVPDSSVMLRPDENLILGVAGGGYEPSNYGQRFQEVHSALTDNGCVLVACLTMAKGAKASATYELPADLNVILSDGKELLHHRIIVADSSDGSIAWSIINSIGVVVCANTFRAYAIGAPAGSVIGTVKHTKNSKGAVSTVIANLAQSIAQAKMANEAVTKLIEQSFTDDEFFKMVQDIHNVEEKLEKKKAAGKEIVLPKQTQDSIDSMLNRHRYNVGNVDTELMGTKWHALMTVQGDEQHNAGGMKPNNENENLKQHRQARHIQRESFGQAGPASKTMLASAYLGCDDIRDDLESRRSQFAVSV